MLNKKQIKVFNKLVEYALDLNNIDESEVADDEIEIKEKINQIKENIKVVVTSSIERDCI